MKPLSIFGSQLRLAILTCAAFAGFVVTLYAATSNEILVRGVATIKFDSPGPSSRFKERRNLARDKLNSRLFDLPGLDIPKVDIPDPVVTIPVSGIPDLDRIPSQVLSAAGNVQTSVGDELGDIQDTAENIVDKIHDLGNMTLPRNITIGTQSYCVHFESNFTCSNLPMNLSTTLPPDTHTILQTIIPEFTSFEEKLEYFTKPSFLYGLIVGVICTFILWVACIVFTFHSCLACVPAMNSKLVKGTVALVLSIPCLIVFAVILGLLSKIDSISDLLPTWLELKHGVLLNFSAGGLCVALIMLMTGGAIMRCG